MAIDDMRTNPTYTEGGTGLTPRTSSSSSPRWVNLALGAWLFISAFAWPHANASFTNTWIMGIVIGGFSLLAMASPAARWVNVAAGAWVFIAAFALPKLSAATFWNNLIVGVAVAFFALVPNMRTTRHAAARP